MNGDKTWKSTSNKIVKVFTKVPSLRVYVGITLFFYQKLSRNASLPFKVTVFESNKHFLFRFTIVHKKYNKTWTWNNCCNLKTKWLFKLDNKERLTTKKSYNVIFAHKLRLGLNIIIRLQWINLIYL